MKSDQNWIFTTLSDFWRAILLQFAAASSFCPENWNRAPGGALCFEEKRGRMKKHRIYIVSRCGLRIFLMALLYPDFLYKLWTISQQNVKSEESLCTMLLLYSVLPTPVHILLPWGCGASNATQFAQKPLFWSANFANILWLYCDNVSNVIYL